MNNCSFPFCSRITNNLFCWRTTNICEQIRSIVVKKEIINFSHLMDLSDSISAIMVFVLLTNYRWFYFRLLWLILFSFAIGYGYLLYTPFLDTWYNEPTVLATDQADFPVEKLPFPAITICSNNKIVYRQLESVLRTQPWKGLKDFNYNITQATSNGRFN